MLSEIFRLSMKLLLKCLLKLLKLIIKAFKVCFAILKLLLQTCIDFWNDNSTQEKIIMIRRWCISTSKKAFHYLLVGLKYTGIGLLIFSHSLWEGLKWLTTKTIKGIIHLRSTLTFLRIWIFKACKTSWDWTKQCGRNLHLFFQKRQQAFRHFRRNKGFKGLLIDTKNYLQTLVNSYMDEGTEDSNNNVLSYDDLINDSSSDVGKHRPIGRQIYNEIKKLIDN